MIRIKLFSLLFFMVSCLFNCKLTAQNQRIYSLKELCNESHTIIMGNVITQNSYKSFDKKHTYTDIQFKVMNKIKGKYNPGSIVNLTIPGGTVNGITTKVIGGPAFKINETNILFLNEYNDTKSTTHYDIITGFAQGKFDIKENSGSQVIKRMDTNIPLIIDESGSKFDFNIKKPVTSDEFIQKIKKLL